jgi:hypothetical protein
VWIPKPARQRNCETIFFNGDTRLRGATTAQSLKVRGAFLKTKAESWRLSKKEL